MPPQRAVILDFDGVIADSMPQHLEAYRRVLAPFDIKVSRMDVYRREGARSESIIRTLLGERPEADDDVEIKRLADEKQRIFGSLGDVKLYPQAKTFVHEVREATPRLGVVTGTRRENLERWAKDLMPLFDAVLASEDYTHDKPHPEPYARAIERLGVPAEGCIVVENAPRGVLSAKEAGAGTVIAITTTLDAAEFEKARPDVIIHDHEAALQAIRASLA